MLDIFDLWLNTGRLFDHKLNGKATRRAVARRQQLLCNVWAFADHAGSLRLQNAAMDELIQTIRVTRRLPMDTDIINMGYGGPPYIRSPCLRHLLVDLLITADNELLHQVDRRCAGQRLADDFFDRDLDPLQRERREQLQQQPGSFHDIVDCCDYHGHEGMSEMVERHRA